MSLVSEQDYDAILGPMFTKFGTQLLHTIHTIQYDTTDALQRKKNLDSLLAGTE